VGRGEELSELQAKEIVLIGVMCTSGIGSDGAEGESLTDSNGQDALLFHVLNLKCLQSYTAATKKS
jgi:hypothetical protein